MYINYLLILSLYQLIELYIMQDILIIHPDLTYIFNSIIH